MEIWIRLAILVAWVVMVTQVPYIGRMWREIMAPPTKWMGAVGPVCILNTVNLIVFLPLKLIPVALVLGWFALYAALWVDKGGKRGIIETAFRAKWPGLSD